ncbi:hypothetical protein WDU94_002397 [Cyamophila willieti]
MFLFAASLLHCAALSLTETSSQNWDSDSRWEPVQVVLPTSETFYIPTAQPRLFTDVKNEEFIGNQHSTAPGFSGNYESPGRYKRQHSSVETQISSHENKYGSSGWSSQDGETNYPSAMNIRSKRFNNAQTDRKNSSEMQRQSETTSEASSANAERTFLNTKVDASEKIDKPDDPTSVLTGIYTECLMTLSFTCLQKKIIVLLEKLNNIQKFNLIGDYLTVVRNNKYATYRHAGKPSREDYDVSNNVIGRSRAAGTTFNESNDLKTMIDDSLDDYFETHVIRLKVPAVFQRVTNVTKDEVTEATHIDFDLSDKAEGRRKKNNKEKGGKKMMAMLGMMMCYKLSMMGPMLMALIGMKALKALILAVISLTISKLMLLKKMRGGGFGGNGGVGLGYTDASSASGSGWDRSLESHNLAYNSYKPEETTFEDTLVPAVQHILQPIHAKLTQQIINQKLY